MTAVRRASADDVPGLVAVINAAYLVEAPFVTGDRITTADVEAKLVAGAFLVIDAPRPGTLAGAVYVEIRGDRGFFALLAVDPGRQKSGLGRVLVEAAEAYCRDAGCAWLDLDVLSVRAELPAIYERLGYSAAGTAPYPDPGRLAQVAHLILMTKAL